MNTAFSYADFTQRNIGFVTERQQQELKASRVFVCGAGGMGGACLQSLVRAGVGAVAVADFDTFEVSNMNRQVFANLRTVGMGKLEATVASLKEINPELIIEPLGQEWVNQLDDLLTRYKIVVNGMDDVQAGIVLYRKAREHGATVIDAYTSPLPSVVVVRPQDPRPEERLRFPTANRQDTQLTAAERAQCVGQEIEYVMVHSSSARHIEIEIARDLLTGKRKRMSFAPMVITTGNLMSFEAIKLILGREPLADWRGYFFNPWTMRIERPRSKPMAWALGWLVRRFLARMQRG
ncbi:ThiF family adenylyltransferase [Hylemonella gracilis]|uniref:ThiF family adenylyltransferase n=1 Tax=Hylemonella gracilis TaxID=80880 RepID=A0A4P6UP70_9BURK|nr:ThiF family adenylyltransferase [Hylemonella gracilis]QBK06090.1 ThiF family adenylyltransferase [Hylemonella gracilis]